MSVNFTIPLETPSKKNSRINLRNGRSIPSKKYREWHDAAAKYIDMPLLIKAPVRIDLDFVHGDLRRRDSDNGTSSIMDLLVDCAVLEDDNWQIVRAISVSNSYRKGEPECRITITII